MSRQLMDAAVEQALAAGRSVIVPTPQRAAALRLAWARQQVMLGLAVWQSPAILTWAAWLDREWRRAQQQSPSPPAGIRVSRSQERYLWERILRDLDASGADLLETHAAALATAAARATQSLISTSRFGVTDEEQLLVSSRRRLKDICEQEGWISLPLAPPEHFSQLQSEAPLIAGQERLLPLQQRFGEMLWPDVALLAPPPAPAAAPSRYLRAPDADAEIHELGQWCLQHLREDGSRRLLVVSARSDPPLRVLATQVWRVLAADTRAEYDAVIDPALLSVEGGEPLLQHALIADALLALHLLRSPVETTQLCHLLLSPYLELGPSADCIRLELCLREWGRARWDHSLLSANILKQTSAGAAAEKAADWLLRLHEIRIDRSTRSAADWATQFDDLLTFIGFPGQRALDTRDAQRMIRWRELLDEFATLDAVSPGLSMTEALSRLHLLAEHSTHQAASSDAAVTCTDDLGDPLVHYDGIWVLGLTERNWPEPPRPNPYVPLGEQQRAGWPEASVTLRAREASHSLLCWRARTQDLVLSYAELEGDIHLRPSPLLAREQPVWESVPVVDRQFRRICEPAPFDQALPPSSTSPTPVQLRSGTRLLELQQDCPFRSQAELRLGAQALGVVSDGIDRRWRGRLLHSLCEGIWAEIRTQEKLLSMTALERADCIGRNWLRAVQSIEKGLPGLVDERALERERQRSVRLMTRVLDLEAQRPPFRVQVLEQALNIEWAGANLRLRVDRIDELDDGSKLLIDYKSGKAGGLRLEGTEPRPIQLVAYMAALAARSAGVKAVALLSLHPAELGFRGRAENDGCTPAGIRRMPDWNAQTLQWRSAVEGLLQAYLAGDARVAPSAGACRHCHLPSFCRIRPEQERLDDALSVEEGAGDE